MLFTWSIKVFDWGLAIESSFCVPSKISVIIPFFQEKPGILTRALESVRKQKIPDGWLVVVIVVDDGSPSPAADEIHGLRFDCQLRLKLIKQANGGVAAARNRGLDEAADDTSVIAFLDSDDIWSANHIARVVDAFTKGFDFYFSDNRRAGNHESYIQEYGHLTSKFLASAPQSDGFAAIPPDVLIGLSIREFPAQLSTVAYRRAIAPDLRFRTALKFAGEDILFLCTVLAAASSTAFDATDCVECGEGLNMYFGQFSWDSPKCLAIRVDQVITHRLIDKIVKLSPASRARNNAMMRYLSQELGFHVARSLLKFPTRVPKAVIRLLKQDTAAAITLPFHVARGALDLALGTYKHSEREPEDVG